MDRGDWQATVTVGFQEVVHRFPSSFGTESPGETCTLRLAREAFPFTSVLT